MKNTLIFAGLMIFVTTCGAFAFSGAATSGTAPNGVPTAYGTFAGTTGSANDYATKDPNGIKVATTNYVTARVGAVTPNVATLTTRATTDGGVVSANTTALAGMGGSLCTGGSGSSCTGETGTGAKLNAPTQVTSGTCTGTSNGYNISACGFIKNSSGKKWVQIVGGVASSGN